MVIGSGIDRDSQQLGSVFQHRVERFEDECLTIGRPDFIHAKIGPLVRAPEITTPLTLGRKYQLGSAAANGHSIEALRIGTQGVSLRNYPCAIGCEARVFKLNRGRGGHELRRSVGVERLSINLREVGPPRKKNDPARIGRPSEWNVAVLVPRQPTGVQEAIAATG